MEAERQEDLTARGQYRSELVEDDDEEDMQWMIWKKTGKCMMIMTVDCDV